MSCTCSWEKKKKKREREREREFVGLKSGTDQNEPEHIMRLTWSCKGRVVTILDSKDKSTLYAPSANSVTRLSLFLSWRKACKALAFRSMFLSLILQITLETTFLLKACSLHCKNNYSIWSKKGDRSVKRVKSYSKWSEIYSFAWKFTQFWVRFYSFYRAIPFLLHIFYSVYWF